MQSVNENKTRTIEWNFQTSVERILEYIVIYKRIHSGSTF